jgi:two-component system chemotaxis family response regulator WspR
MNEHSHLPAISGDSDAEFYKAMVLLVDDQVMVVEAVRRALANQPYLEFHYCLNPHEAVDAARGIKPTVILQDLIMPGVDGLDLVKRYRQTPEIAQTPIIVLSSQEEPLVKSRAFAEGANDYLVKLPDRVELLARIRYHSKAYINEIQRTEAFRQLQESQQLLMQANLKLERMTRVDGLTGLANRRYFNEYLGEEWRRLLRSGEPLTVIMIDVDNFKSHNDIHGHLAGDDVLIAIGEAIQDICARSSDFAARFGGEEFVVILCGTTQAGARIVAERLRQSVERLKIIHANIQKMGGVTVSIGVATVVPTEHLSPEQVIEAADQALFRAKAEGKNRVAYGDLPDR